MSDAPATLRFGVFWLGRMQLALPITALKEVIPMGPLSTLPSEATCMLGAIDLRGLMVPVMDLRCTLQPGLPPASTASVVILTHGGRLLGLAADGIVGVYEVPAGQVHPVGPGSTQASVLQAGFSRPDDRSLVSVLSPEAIVDRPHLPLLTPPDKSLEGGAEAATAPSGGGSGYLEDARHLMLMRCGGMPLAMASAAVHTTVIQPELGEAHLASGYFRGMMRFDDTDIPAVSLSLLCGFAVPQDAGLPQAFLVRYPTGLVAFLVDQIVDVVMADGQRIAPVPHYANLQAGCFSGTLPDDAVANRSSTTHTGAAAFHLVLDDAALLADTRLQALADMSQQRLAERTLAGPATNVPAGESRTAQVLNVPQQMLAFHAGVDMASPIVQISEILPWQPEAAVPTADGASLIMSRGCPIPVYCLASLLHQPLPPTAVAGNANVLVVDDSGHRIGFRVPRLVTIAEGQTKSKIKTPSPTTGGANSHLHDMVQMPIGTDERLLRRLDLVALAQSLRPAALN